MVTLVRYKLDFPKKFVVHPSNTLLQIGSGVSLKDPFSPINKRICSVTI